MHPASALSQQAQSGGLSGSASLKAWVHCGSSLEWWQCQRTRIQDFGSSILIWYKWPSWISTKLGQYVSRDWTGVCYPGHIHILHMDSQVQESLYWTFYWAFFPTLLPWFLWHTQKPRVPPTVHTVTVVAAAYCVYFLCYIKCNVKYFNIFTDLLLVLKEIGTNAFFRLFSTLLKHKHYKHSVSTWCVLFRLHFPPCSWQITTILSLVIIVPKVFLIKTLLVMYLSLSNMLCSFLNFVKMVFYFE